MVNRASPESSEVLQQLWKANTSDADIALAVEGKEPVVPEPVVAPVPSFETEAVNV